ncbi:hypothetical protein [Micromonospora sp. LOL_024]|uniref:hypothetical protein n=1 Tax=Micromonospora sp. LOL_024 TaxID=3345412 RepID=UPI003A871EE2
MTVSDTRDHEPVATGAADNDPTAPAKETGPAAGTGRGAGRPVARQPPQRPGFQRVDAGVRGARGQQSGLPAQAGSVYVST